MVEDDWPGGEDSRHPTSLLTRMSPGSHNHLAASLAPPRLYFTKLKAPRATSSMATSPGLSKVPSWQFREAPHRQRRTRLPYHPVGNRVHFLQRLPETTRVCFDAAELASQLLREVTTFEESMSCVRWGESQLRVPPQPCPGMQDSPKGVKLVTAECPSGVRWCPSVSAGVRRCRIVRNPNKHGACRVNDMGVLLMVHVVAGGLR